MSWLGRRHAKPGDPGPGPEAQAVGELLDQYHQRASISDGDQLLIVPGKVLENIAFAMERVDTDIETAVSIEEDVAPVDELVSMVQNLHLGPPWRCTWSTPPCGSCQPLSRRTGPEPSAS
jgi:hypothetical protein